MTGTYLTPHELAVRYVIPYLRALVALELNSRGLSQVRIAKIFGISQAMINNYLSKDRDYYLKQLEEVGLYREDVEKYVYSLVASHRSPAELIYTFTSIINEILATQKLCKLHRRLNPMLPQDCSICRELFHYKITDPHIKLVEELVRKFTGYPQARELVPEIGTNIVYSPPGATSIRELIAVPGRIVKTDNEVVAVGSPSYGGSRYLATLLLKAQRVEPRINIVINIRYRQEYLDKLEKLGYNTMSVGPSSNPEEQYRRVEEALRRLKKPETAVADLGAIGLEPTIYVFHSDPRKLVEDVLSLPSYNL